MEKLEGEKEVTSVCPECGRTHYVKIEGWEEEEDYYICYCEECFGIEFPDF